MTTPPLAGLRAKPTLATSALALLASLLLEVALLPSADAHGGTYVPPPPAWLYPGPGDTNGPPPGAPTGGNRPSRPRRPSTPSPSGPAAPAPSSPRPGGPGAPNPFGGPTTPGGYASDLSLWSVWWGYNQHRFLNLKAHVFTSGPRTPGPTLDAGTGTRKQRSLYGIYDEDRRDVVGPALLRAFERAASVDVLTTSMLALSKLHPVYVPPEGPALHERFAAQLSHSNLEVTETAAVALGMLGDARAVRILCEVALDSERGRELVKRARVPAHSRPMAVLALGLAGARCSREEVRRYIVHNLEQVYENDRSSSADLGVACVTSMGLVPLENSRYAGPSKGAAPRPASSSRGAQLEFLARVLADSHSEEAVRAHASTALARLAAHEDGALAEVATSALLDTFRANLRLRARVEYGLTVGLGMLGDADQDPHDRALRKQLEKRLKDGDTFERNQALLAIATVASRPGYGEGQSDEAWKELEALLSKQFSRGKSSARPWAALALGIEGYYRLQQRRPISEGTSRMLRKRLEAAKSPSEVGALCIALGLRRDMAAAPLLLNKLEKTRDDAARGHVAIGLGLLGAHEATPALRELLAESTTRPTLLRDTAMALALLGDRSVVDSLLTILSENRTSYVLSATVLALGDVGDKRAIAPLVTLLEDQGTPEITRRFAAVGLGIVCERELLPWTALYTTDLNYAALTETLLSGSGQGLLNQR